MSNHQSDLSDFVFESSTKQFNKRQVTRSITGNTPRNLFTVRNVCINIQYFGVLSFGTPAIDQTFLFDSGSTKTWIKSSKCKCGGNFTNNSSSSFILYNQLASVSYLDGTKVSGRFASDTLSLNNLRAENFIFFVAESIVNPSQPDPASNYDGISGFGFSADNPSLFSEIFRNYPSLPPVASYFIDGSETNGGITIGGIDTARFSGPLAVENIVSRSNEDLETFSLKLDSIHVDKTSISLNSVTSTNVLIDTGTSLALLPDSVAQLIHQKLNFLPLGNDFPGFYGIYCPERTVPSKLPVVTITLGKVKLRFTPDIYTFLITDTFKNNTYCVSGFQAHSSDQYIIGNVLLRRYYTVFDLVNKRIGFATCNRSPNITSSIVSLDLTKSVKGIADPSTVFGETSSESFGQIIYLNQYLLAALLNLLILT